MWKIKQSKHINKKKYRTKNADGVLLSKIKSMKIQNFWKSKIFPKSTIFSKSKIVMVDSRIQYSEFAWHETCKKHIFSFLGALYQKLSVTFSKSSIVTFFDLLVTFSCAGQAGARVYPNRVYPDPYPYPTGTGLVRVHTQKSSGRVRSQLLYPRVYPIP